MRFALILCVAAAAARCAQPSTSPTVTAPFSQTDLRVGTGGAAASGNSLTVNYTGWLYDATKPDQKGLQFDSSIGRAVFTFTLGSGQVISGWETGLVGMKVGGLRRLIIPPSQAYGGSRSNSIPPNATLLFDVELLDVQ